MTTKRVLIGGGVAVALLGTPALAIALLLPAVQSAREAARKTKPVKTVKVNVKLLQAGKRAKPLAGRFIVKAPPLVPLALANQGMLPPRPPRNLAGRMALRVKRVTEEELPPAEEEPRVCLVTVDGREFDLGPANLLDQRLEQEWQLASEIDPSATLDNDQLTLEELFGSELIVKNPGEGLEEFLMARMPYPFRLKRRLANAIADCEQVCSWVVGGGEVGHVLITDVEVDGGERAQNLNVMIVGFDKALGPYRVELVQDGGDPLLLGAFDIKRNGKPKKFIPDAGVPGGPIPNIDVLQSAADSAVTLQIVDANQEVVFSKAVVPTVISDDDARMLVPAPDPVE